MKNEVLWRFFCKKMAFQRQKFCPKSNRIFHSPELTLKVKADMMRAYAPAAHDPDIHYCGGGRDLRLAGDFRGPGGDAADGARPLFFEVGSAKP